MRLRLYESAITSRSVFLRKICGPATFDFATKSADSGHRRADANDREPTWGVLALALGALIGRQRHRPPPSDSDSKPTESASGACDCQGSFSSCDRPTTR